MNTDKIQIDNWLLTLLGRQELVEQWWTSQNYEFGMRSPIEVYQSGDEGCQHVVRYVRSALIDEYL